MGDGAADVGGGLLIGMMSGRGARQRNEDACGHWGWSEQGSTGPVCCVLADGAGGHGGGDVASRIAVAAVLDAFAERPACEPARVRELVDLSNRAVVTGQPHSHVTQDMRSTLVVWLCDPELGAAAWGHTGDSRLYCFRNGRLLAHTRDHSLYQSLIDAGIAPPAELRGNPQRNVLLASLGSLDDFVADVPVASFPLLPGDAFLMCSDGFWEPLSEVEMEAALGRSADPQAWVDGLGQSILRQARPGQDNFSAIAVWYAR